MQQITYIFSFILHPKWFRRKKLKLFSTINYDRIVQSARWLGYGYDCPGFDCRQLQEILLFSKASRIPLGPTLTTNLRVPGSFRYDGRGVKLTSHLHRVQRLRMSGAIPLLPYVPSWSAQNWGISLRKRCMGLVSLTPRSLCVRHMWRFVRHIHATVQEEISSCLSSWWPSRNDEEAKNIRSCACRNFAQQSCVCCD
jgi:hypothetical protein